MEPLAFDATDNAVRDTTEKRRSWLLVWLCLILLDAIALGVSCRSQTPPDARPSPSSVPEPNPLPWREAYGQFYTLDLARAQDQIPFRIVLPTYVPERRKDAPPPGIQGPLRDYQYNGKVEVQIFYSVDLGSEVRGLIHIYETNYPVLPGDPKLNPDLKEGKIRGKDIIWTEGNFALGPGVNFYFSQDNVYFDVGIHNFPRDEAYKIVESMIQ